MVLSITNALRNKIFEKLILIETWVFYSEKAEKLRGSSALCKQIKRSNKIDVVKALFLVATKACYKQKLQFKK